MATASSQLIYTVTQVCLTCFRHILNSLGIHVMQTRFDANAARLRYTRAKPEHNLTVMLSGFRRLTVGRNARSALEKRERAPTLERS
eukprot:scaffold18543_cov140-Isochrysis_galbana.AAC.4